MRWRGRDLSYDRPMPDPLQMREHLSRSALSKACEMLRKPRRRRGFGALLGGAAALLDAAARRRGLAALLALLIPASAGQCVATALASPSLRFAPVTGDWEGRVDGFPASFELVYRPLFAPLYNRPPYGFQNLVIFAPASCPITAGSHTETTISEGPFLTPLSPGGGFGLAKSRKIRGGLIGARSAKIAYPLHLRTAAAGVRCPFKLTWRLHPAHRRPVSDGTWRLTYSTGESVRFKVLAGGRLAAGIPLPKALRRPSCPAVGGRVDLFVRPHRAAVDAEAGRGLSIELSFTSSSTAKGKLSVGARSASCPERSLSLRARLIS